MIPYDQVANIIFRIASLPRYKGMFESINIYFYHQLPKGYSYNIIFHTESDQFNSSFIQRFIKDIYYFTNPGDHYKGYNFSYCTNEIALDRIKNSNKWRKLFTKSFPY